MYWFVYLWVRFDLALVFGFAVVELKFDVRLLPFFFCYESNNLWLVSFGAGGGEVDEGLHRGEREIETRITLTSRVIKDMWSIQGGPKVSIEYIVYSIMYTYFWSILYLVVTIKLWVKNNKNLGRRSGQRGRGRWLRGCTKEAGK